MFLRAGVSGARASSRAGYLAPVPSLGTVADDIRNPWNRGLSVGFLLAALAVVVGFASIALSANLPSVLVPLFLAGFAALMVLDWVVVRRALGRWPHLVDVLDMNKIRRSVYRWSAIQRGLRRQRGE